MPPRYILHLVRHAEATHNPLHDTSIHDPSLAEHGVSQSKELTRKFPWHESVGCVIVSPMRRGIETAVWGFGGGKCLGLDVDGKGDSGGAGESQARLILSADLQPHTSRPCDTGSSISVLKTEFPFLPWDEGEMDLGLDLSFPEKGTLYADDDVAMEGRRERVLGLLKREFRVLAEGRGERGDVVVVSHGGTLERVFGVGGGGGKGEWRRGREGGGERGGGRGGVGGGKNGGIDWAGWKSLVVEFNADHQMMVVEVLDGGR